MMNIYKILFFLLLAANVIGGTVFLISRCDRETELPSGEMPDAVPVLCADDDILSSGEEHPPVPDPAVREGAILSGEGLEQSLLAMAELSIPQLLEVVNALRDHVEFTTFAAGERLTLTLSEDLRTVAGFSYSPDAAHRHELKRDATGVLRYSEWKGEAEKRWRIIEGMLETTVEKALSEMDGISPRVRQSIYGFTESIDGFRAKARSGDRFRIVVQEEFYKGEMLTRSKALYLAYDGKLTGLKEGFYYQDEDEKSAYNAFYEQNGKSSIKTGLRIPVDRVHISSPFGMRIHPITGKRKKHEGIDYTGRIGDPVYAVAEGTVERTGADNLNGKFLFLKHAKGRESCYLHLDKILVTRGQRVKPGDRIAHLGTTGRSTGPHLHLGWKEPGKGYVDPLKLKMSAAEKLTGAKLAAFTGEIGKIRKFLAEKK